VGSNVATIGVLDEITFGVLVTKEGTALGWSNDLPVGPRVSKNVGVTVLLALGAILWRDGLGEGTKDGSDKGALVGNEGCMELLLVLGGTVCGDSDGIDEELVGPVEGAALFSAIGKSVRVAEGVADFDICGVADEAFVEMSLGTTVGTAEVGTFV
jgi:hypothetical protein